LCSVSLKVNVASPACLARGRGSPGRPPAATARASGAASSSEQRRSAGSARQRAWRRTAPSSSSHQGLCRRRQGRQGIRDCPLPWWSSLASPTAAPATARPPPSNRGPRLQPPRLHAPTLESSSGAALCVATLLSPSTPSQLEANPAR
jgi:hypothetical protein